MQSEDLSICFRDTAGVTRSTAANATAWGKTGKPENNRGKWGQFKANVTAERQGTARVYALICRLHVLFAQPARKRPDHLEHAGFGWLFCNKFIKSGDK